jgi:hypothetical protein
MIETPLTATATVDSSGQNQQQRKRKSDAMTVEEAPVRVVEQKTLAAAAKRVREASLAPKPVTSASVFDFVDSGDVSMPSHPIIKKDETSSVTIETTSSVAKPVKGKSGSGGSIPLAREPVVATTAAKVEEIPIVIKSACEVINKGRLHDLISVWTPELTALSNSLMSSESETISPLHLSLQKFFWEGAAFLIAAGCSVFQPQRVVPIPGDSLMLESDVRLKEPVSALSFFSIISELSSTESASSKRGKALKALRPILKTTVDSNDSAIRLLAVEVIRRLASDLEKKKKSLPETISRAIPDLFAMNDITVPVAPTQKSRLSREPAAQSKKPSTVNQETAMQPKTDVFDTKAEDSDSLPDIDIEELVVPRVSTEEHSADTAAKMAIESTDNAPISHELNSKNSTDEVQPEQAPRNSVVFDEDLGAAAISTVISAAPKNSVSEIPETSVLLTENVPTQLEMPPTPLVSQISLQQTYASSSSAIRSLGAAQVEKARQDDAERERERKREKIRAEIEARKAAAKAGGASSSIPSVLETTTLAAAQNGAPLLPIHETVATSNQILPTMTLVSTHRSVAEEAESRRRAEEDARRQALELAAAEKARAVAAEVQGARAKALQAVGQSLSANFSTSSSQAAKPISHQQAALAVVSASITSASTNVCESSENLPRVMSPRSVNVQQSTGLVAEKKYADARIVSPNRLQQPPIAPPIPILLPSGLKPGDNENYAMSDREGSSGDDDEEEDGTSRPKKPVPDWAKGPALEAAIHAQYGDSGTGGFADPDRIFEEITSCDLEEVFSKNAKKKRFTKRTSSGNWLPDKLTHGERSQYRKDMGWDK